MLRQTWIVLLLLVTAGASFAQVFEFGVGGGVSRISNRTLAVADPGPPPLNVDLMDGYRVNFQMTLNTYTHIGGEIGYSYVRSNWDYLGQEVGTAAHQVRANPVFYLTSEGSKVRPFVSAGVGFTSFAYPGYSVTAGGSELKFGVNYGGGIKVRVTDKYLIRIDYRQYLTPKPDFSLSVIPPQGWLRMNEVSMGFAYTM